MRAIHTYPLDHQPQAAYKRATDARTGAALPHKIVSLDGFVMRRARNGTMYEAPSTQQIDTSKFLVVAADELYSYSRCRVHAEGLDTPLIVDKSANYLLLELGFDPTFILNDPHRVSN